MSKERCYEVATWLKFGETVQGIDKDRLVGGIEVTLSTTDLIFSLKPDYSQKA